MTLWNKFSMDDQGQMRAAATFTAAEAAPVAEGPLRGEAKAVQQPGRSSQQLQEEVLSSLKSKRGILDGRDLYRVYKESDQPALRTAIRELEKNNLVSVKGDLEAPLGVFQSVLVER